jgi:hypothetical protein
MIGIMADRKRMRTQTLLLASFVLAAGILLAGCNLGPNAPAEPFDLTPGELVPQEEGGDANLQVTLTPMINIPPTDTAVPELLPAEELGPVTLDSGDYRTQEPITIRVQVGTSVTNDTCTWTHQDTNQSGTLGTPTVNTLDDSTVEKVYSFTPELAGTFAITCTGIATTASGQRAVNANGSPFNVEAKG